MLTAFVFGWFLTPLNAAIGTIMQVTVENRLRGRASAAFGTLIGTANIASMALAGVVAAAIGVRAVLIGAGALVAAAGLLAAWLFHGAPAGMPARRDGGTAASD